ncbi:MAG: Gfo/Idh/MocA family oxidoreductase [Planctomycetes bacterium]|nr:Gfo/Idh/MocA family oxidoreductase [Planctomycetota bacterium]
MKTRTKASGETRRKIRIGVVGGGFGGSFQWHEHPDCIVEAVSDLKLARRKSLMETYGCSKSYTSLEKMLGDKAIDAVAVFSGAPDHVRHCVACLEAGKHVFCAVPAATTIEDCRLLVRTVKKTKLTYMMAETSWYRQSVISARKWFAEGKFGDIHYTEAEYHHSGMEKSLWFEGSKRKPTWRHGYPPMLYPTHCTAFLVGVTGERMTHVSCTGWGDGSKLLKGNVYGNPFWNQTAMFLTDKGNSFRVSIHWNTPAGGCERGQWFGQKMCYYDPTPNGQGCVIRRKSDEIETDDAGFERTKPKFEKHRQKQWWRTNMLPKALRHPSGHGGSHTFLTHEFIDSLLSGRTPAVNVYEAVAMTAPGIIANESSLKGGKQLKIPSFDPRT